MRLLFVAADFGGSSFYRIVTPAGVCSEIYDKSMWSLPDRLPLPYLKEADLLVIQRQCADQAYKSTQNLLKMNKVIVSEIDDNLWSIPQNTPAMSKFWTKERIKGFENILKISHAVTVSTPRLAKIIKEYNDNVFVLPNLVVFDKAYIKPEYDKIRIGWAGSDTHLGDFTDDIQDALLDIKEKYKDKVDIVMFGVTPPKLFTKVTFYPFVAPHLYLAKLQKIGLDIGLVPNNDNAFNSCRSNVKFVEYSSMGAVTIASNIESYRDSITNGQNGILVKNSRKHWFKAIQDLIENVDYRNLMVGKAYHYCYEKFSVQENKNQYKIYYEIMNRVQGG